nr:unnamed protein product [Digitaria exilis]
MSRLPSWLGGNKKIVDELQVSKKKQQPPEPRPRPRLPKPVLGKDNIMVLSIDGGGIRGLIPASVLTNLEDLLQEAEKNLDREQKEKKEQDGRLFRCDCGYKHGRAHRGHVGGTDQGGGGQAIKV